MRQTIFSPSDTSKAVCLLRWDKYTLHFYCDLQLAWWLALVAAILLLLCTFARSAVVPPQRLKTIVGQQSWAMYPTRLFVCGFSAKLPKVINLVMWILAQTESKGDKFWWCGFWTNASLKVIAFGTVGFGPNFQRWEFLVVWVLGQTKSKSDNFGGVDFS